MGQSDAAGLKSVDVLSSEESARLRSEFIDRFIKVDEMPYGRIVGSTEEGCAYTTGYLWECFQEPMRVVSSQAAIEWLQPRREVYALWDIPSRRRVWSEVVFEPYDRFPQGAVIRANGATFLELRTVLPEDIYFFDDTRAWCLALTHETEEDGTDFCLLSEPRDDRRPA